MKKHNNQIISVESCTNRIDLVENTVLVLEDKREELDHSVKVNDNFSNMWMEHGRTLKYQENLELQAKKKKEHITKP